MKLFLFIPIIFLILLIPSWVDKESYAITELSEEGFYEECEPRAFGFDNVAMDFICWLDLYKMWGNINTLFDRVTTLDDNLISTNAIINERIDSLEVYAGNAMTKANKALDRADNQNHRIMVINSEIVAMSKEIEGMSSVVNEISPVIGEVDELKKTISNSTDDVNNLSDEVRLMGMDMEEAAAEIADLKSANVNLVGEITNMTSHISEMEKRLNKVDPPDVDFAINVEPKSVSGRDEIRIFGTATKNVENDNIHLRIYTPNKTKIVYGALSFGLPIQNDNTFSYDLKAGGKRWTVDGDYVIVASHSGDNNQEVLLSYYRNGTRN